MPDRALSRLVVPLDGSSTAQHALPVATALAAMRGAAVTLVSVVADDNQVQGAADMLRRAAAAADLSADIEVLVGLPAATTLCSYVQPGRGQTLVMTTHARTAVGELFLGSVADEMVRRSPVPVVLVGPHVDPRASDSAYHDVVVCIDGTVESERLLPLAAVLHQDLGMHPWLFQVQPDPAAGSPIGVDLLETAQLHRAADALKGDGVDVDWDVGHGSNRADAIVEFAAQRPSPIIAIATRGRDAVSRLSSSSLTVTVARTAPCPVLVIGPACADLKAKAIA